MKRLILSLVAILAISHFVFAQDKEEEKDKGFKKENLFTGGSVTVSFFNGSTILGASPVFGYQLAKWVDAGIVLNYTYASQRDVQEFDDKLKQYTYGGGAFMRLYPVRFLFLQGQFEHNFTKQKYTPASVFYQPFKETVEANSFLVGGGYTQGREPGSNTFYYVSVLFDVIKDENSPYVNLVYNPNTGTYSVRAVPIIRAGINIGLFQGGGNRRRR
ncbi:MAG TPA: hypothetical protein VMZ03_11915 [Chitinophagaceae bacterium]|nr:hypothetical protein [Chitinophagaceae bacterium]